MALSIDPATKVISVPQADLTPVSGTLYTLDTDQFRLDVLALLDDEDYIWMPTAYTHNTEVTVAGVTYARTIEFINGYSIEFEDGQYTVRLEGSNNNIFSVQDGILVQNQVQVIPTNSTWTPTRSSERWRTGVSSTSPNNLLDRSVWACYSAVVIYRCVSNGNSPVSERARPDVVT
jgi:hypothetical protein